MDYEKLLEFCTTERQTYIVEKLSQGLTQEEISKELGITRTAVTKCLGRIKSNAAKRGHSPEHDLDKIVDPMFIVKGTSSLYKEGENKPSLQWVKTRINQKQLDSLAKESARAFFEDRNPINIIPAPNNSEKDLLCCYVLNDLHLGMYSFIEEEWGIEKSINNVRSGIQKLLSRTPSSKECIIAQLGDLFHLDDPSNQTKRGKHPLDVDGIYENIVSVGMSCYRSLIDACLEKHDKVHIINVRGNHDDISTLWAGVAIQSAYQNNPRVVVDNSTSPYFYHRYGNNLIGCCHGHTCKMTDLPGIMVADQRENVGETIFRYWLTAHIHHERVLDGRICKVESFRSPSEKDAWHEQKGYRSKRDFKAIVFHKEHGETERHTVSIHEIEKGSDHE